MQPSPQQKTLLQHWLDPSDFPAGAFTIFCAIVGGVANYESGLWISTILYRHNPTVFLIWILLGIGSGIGVAVAFLNWLCDNSPD